jgi:hypothetical protein
MTKKASFPDQIPQDNKPCRVVAVVVGIEDYQPTENGTALPKVDYARYDAGAFAKVVQSIYPGDRLNLQLLIDAQATWSGLDYTLKQTIEALTADDLFVFYYVGHGFHGAGGNRITAWDSRPFNIEGSTLLLREKLSDRLAETEFRSREALLAHLAGVLAASALGIDDIISVLADYQQCPKDNTIGRLSRALAMPRLGEPMHAVVSAVIAAAA